MKNLKYAFLAVLLFATSSFNSAQAITADELLIEFEAAKVQIIAQFGQIAQSLFDLDARISNLENSNPNLGGYGVSFSVDGAPKNVVVSSQDFGNGNTGYYVRSRYATSTEQISINGVLTQRPFIANYAFAQTDSLGNLLAVSNYIEAPDTASYIVYNVEASDYDPVSIAKTVTDDTLWEDWNLCNYGQTTLCVVDVSLSASGDHVRSYNWSSIRGLSGPVNINGATFDDVRLEQYITSNFARVRAKGIGEVMRVANDGSWERKAIYYQANGVSQGTLAGTPFAAGQPLFGLFF